MRVSGPFGAERRGPGARGRPAGESLDAVEALLPTVGLERRPVRRRTSPSTWSTPAASGSGRCSCCWPRSSATPASGVVPAAVVVELTHLATLYHDDVMDEAPLRRGCAVGQRPLGQHRRDPHRRLPVRAGVGHPRRPRPGGRTHPGPDLRAAGDRADPRDGGSGRGRGPARALPRGRRRQDRFAHRDVGAVRRDAVRAPTTRRSTSSPSSASGSGSPSSSPTTCSTSLSDSTRVGEDAGHRPARGRPHAARAPRAAAPGARRTPASASCSSGPLPDDARPRRGARAPARAPGDGRRRGRAAAVGRRRPRRCSPRCPTARARAALEPVRRRRRRAPADPPVRRRRPRARRPGPVASLRAGRRR